MCSIVAALYERREFVRGWQGGVARSAVSLLTFSQGAKPAKNVFEST